MSARAGRAIVVSDSEHYLLEAGRQIPPQPCAPGQLNNFLSLVSDIRQLEAGAFPFAEARQTLERGWREQSALDLLLMALDGDLEPGLREDAAQVASRLLARTEVCLAVRHRLLGTPLPKEADIEGLPETPHVTELVREASHSREMVVIANQAWDRVFWDFGHSERREIKDRCIWEGGFTALVKDLQFDPDRHFQHWLRHLGTPLAEPPVSDLLRKWQEMAGRFLEETRLCRSVGLEQEVGEVFSRSLKQVPLEKLPRNALDLSEKARTGIILHTLTLHGADPNLRRRVLDKIGVGRA